MSFRNLLIKKAVLIIGMSSFLYSAAVAQDNILTASEFLDSVSAGFGEITDYEATITITQDETVEYGTIYYKKPHLLRINFEEPAEQVFCKNDEKLLIYIPQYQVILQQEFPRRSSNTLAAMATSQGLNILRNNYKVAYLIGPETTLLEEGAEERVIKLKFTWRDIKEGFKEIIVSFSTKGFIRRMVGTQAITNKEVQFDYTNIILNQGIPDERFEYEPPPYANVYDNFLSEEN